MFENERGVYGSLLDYARKLVDDVPDAAFTEQPIPELNHPAWVLGHLAFVASYALKNFGQAMLVDESYAKLFGPGSKPVPDRGVYPSKEALLAAYEAGHAAVDTAVANLTAEQLSAPNPVRRLAHRLPTMTGFVGHILTSHEAIHLGQLSAWRRVTGRSSV